MSLLPKKIPIDRKGIESIKNIKDMKQWLGSFIRTVDQWYEKMFNHIESGGMSTADWNIRQATDLDVTDGNAQAAGNLLIEHKTTGKKAEHEA